MVLQRFVEQKGAAMYELFGALAFAAMVAGYVLAVVFIRHEDDDGAGHQSVRHQETDSAPSAVGKSVSRAP
jgi:hypothetical protein